MIPVFTVVIPSRFASTRLPGKPLQMIAGKPMVQHVWEQACKSSAQRVVLSLFFCFYTFLLNLPIGRRLKLNRTYLFL